MKQFEKFHTEPFAAENENEVRDLVKGLLFSDTSTMSLMATASLFGLDVSPVAFVENAIDESFDTNEYIEDSFTIGEAADHLTEAVITSLLDFIASAVSDKE